jgi:hypothetical protein
MSSLVTPSTVTPSAFPTTFNVVTKHPKGETADNAINIGNLQEENTSIDISDAGKVAGSAVSSTFTTQGGDIVSLSREFSNIVDEAATRYQLYDSQGNIVADSDGTGPQLAAYDQWINGTLSAPADTYTAIATPMLPSTTLAINTTQSQGTSLLVNSQLTGGNPDEYYDFSLSTGNNIKMAFDESSSMRIQLLNSQGNVVADNEGNSFEKNNFQQLTSNTGLTATTGNYTIKVSYPSNADLSGDTTPPNIKYDLQLYSGSSYAVVYKTAAAAQVYDPSAIGSTTPTADAQLYTRQDFNKINATLATAVNIGWLAQDKSSLDVFSQLTSTDNADIYSLTLQQGDNLKFGFTSPTDQTVSNLRVQVYLGQQVIADNYGTPAQQAAYKALTTTNGLAAQPSVYSIKISYAPNATQTNLSYEFGVFSGTTYSATYKTNASPQTYGNYLLSGAVSGSAPGSAMAAYLNKQANLTEGETDTSLTDALQLTI